MGALMLEEEAMPRVAGRLEEEMFHEGNNRRVYRAIRELYDGGRAVDIVTVTGQLLRMGAPKEWNVPFHVTQLTAKVASSAHLEEHVLILGELYLRRKAIEQLTVKLPRMQDLTRDVYVELDALADMLDRMRRGEQGDGLRAMPALMAEALRQGEERMLNNRDGLTGIPTGLAALDRLTAGWQKSELTIIGARPSTGKTSLTAFMARVAAQAGYRVAYFSLEMAAERLADKWLVAETGILAESWRQGTLTSEERRQVAEAAEKLGAAAIHVDDSTVISMERIRNKCRLLQKRGACDIVFIDYLQLVQVTGSKKSYTMAIDMGEMANKAKAIAKELKVPVIVLSQLNRDSEKRADKRPAMYDLRESGGIEQVADVVALIHNPAKAGLRTDPRSGYPAEGLGVLIVEKNRNGATGDIYFGYNESMTRFGFYEPPRGWILKNARPLTAKEIREG